MHVQELLKHDARLIFINNDPCIDMAALTSGATGVFHEMCANNHHTMNKIGIDCLYLDLYQPYRVQLCLARIN